MKTFTGWQYLLIDAFNHHTGGLETFENRITWGEKNLDILESLADEAKDKPRFLKSVMAIRRAQANKPIGHMVSLDASASGMQIMSALTGCHSGAAATGLVDPDCPADAYLICSEIMSGILGREVESQNTRLKNAVMTSLYGSRAEPEKEFGEGTEELEAFYQAMSELAPGPVKLLQELLASWQPGVLMHEWQLPDGYEAKVRVMEKVESRIRVDELDGASFTYIYHQNLGKDWDRKNAANVVHSIDAYVMRSLVRRCSYNPDVANWAKDVLSKERRRRENTSMELEPIKGSALFRYYVTLYQRSGIADLVILPHLSSYNAMYLSDAHLAALERTVNDVIEHRPFPIIAVHDDFACHPNNMNYVRKHYAHILAELAESRLVEWVLCQLHNTEGKYLKESENLGEVIRKSNYALH